MIRFAAIALALLMAGACVPAVDKREEVSMDGKVELQRIFYSVAGGSIFRLIDRQYGNICYIVEKGVSCVPMH